MRSNIKSKIVIKMKKKKKTNSLKLNRKAPINQDNKFRSNKSKLANITNNHHLIHMPKSSNIQNLINTI